MVTKVLAACSALALGAIKINTLRIVKLLSEIFDEDSSLQNMLNVTEIIHRCKDSKFFDQGAAHCIANHKEFVRTPPWFSLPPSAAAFSGTQALLTTSFPCLQPPKADFN